MSKEKLKNKGITLIALIITIIVMLILTGVTLSITLGDNGLVNKAKEATTQTQLEMDRELLLSAVVGAISEDGIFVKENIVLPDGFTLNGDIYTNEKGNRFTISENGEITVAGNGNVGGDIIEDGEGEVVTNPWIERGLSADWEYGEWYVSLYYTEEKFVFLGEDGSSMFYAKGVFYEFTSEEVDEAIATGVFIINKNEIVFGEFKIILMEDGLCIIKNLNSGYEILSAPETCLEYNLEGTYLSESGNEKIVFTLDVSDCKYYYISGDTWYFSSSSGYWEYVKYKDTYYINEEFAEVSADSNTITYNGTTYTKQAN